MPESLVVIPTYNERDNLGPIVERVLATGVADVLVVDDGSPDRTGELADQLAASDDRVHVLHRSTKSGLGAAYLAGFTWGLSNGYDALIEMDADGSHHPEALPAMLDVLRECDVVLGSRWVRGGRTVGWSWNRRLLSRGGNLYSRLALGIGIKDATGGFRAYRASALRVIDLRDVESAGYCFQLDMVWRALQLGLRVVETPITFTERLTGQSKMSNSIILEAIGRVTIWGARRRIANARQVVLHGNRLPSVRSNSSVST